MESEKMLQKILMKAMLTLLIGFIYTMPSCAALPKLLDFTRSGDAFYLVETSFSNGKITAVVRREMSGKSLARTADLLCRQGANGREVSNMKYNQFKLRYDRDGKHYCRIYDRYYTEDGKLVRNLRLNADKRHEIQSAAVLPGKAYIECMKELGIEAPVPFLKKEELSPSGTDTVYSSLDYKAVALADFLKEREADPCAFDREHSVAMVRLKGFRGANGSYEGVASMILLSKKPGKDTETDGTLTALCCFDEDERKKMTQTAPGDEIAVEGVYIAEEAESSSFILDRCHVLPTNR